MIIIFFVRYTLWLIECSHESGKQWAVNFFGLACSFRGLISIIDEFDGIRVLYNLVCIFIYTIRYTKNQIKILLYFVVIQISTLPIMSNDETLILSDDEEYAQRQCLRCVMVALKRYIETHLALKVDQLRR